MDIMNLPVSDLRKGNLIKTEHGILAVHHICFGDIYVCGKDGRILYARNTEGILINDESVDFREQLLELYAIAKPIWEKLNHMIFIHQVQNIYYWLTNKDFKYDSRN